MSSKSRLAELIEQLKSLLYLMGIPDDIDFSLNDLKALIDPFIDDLTALLVDLHVSISRRALAENKVALHELSKFSRAITLLFRLLQSEYVSY